MTKYQFALRMILLSALVIGTGIRVEAAATPPAYHVTDLGTLGGTYSVGIGINASGQVAGDSFMVGDATFNAFLYDGTLHDLGTLGGSFSNGHGINASGQVSGYSDGHAFLWTPTTPNGTSGTMIDLETLGGTLSYGLGINDSGQVAGYSYTTGDTVFHAFLYDGTLNDLGTLGGSYSAGHGINASGQVTGDSTTTVDNDASHAFLYNGTLHDLGTLGGTNSVGFGINDSGQVAGYSQTTGNAAQHAFMYDGTLNDLGTLGGTDSYGLSINASGQVVGQSYTTGDAVFHAFLYTSGDGMVDLNTLIDPLSGWELRIGNAINDAGQITGVGFNGSESHAFLLTPIVPEPASLSLVAFCVAAFAVRRNRRIINLLCLCCALSVTAAAHAAQYTVTDLGTLVNGTISYGIGISGNGQVTGEAGGTRAFLYNGTMHDLGTLGGTFSLGSGVNASGQVTGYSYTAGDAASHAFLYDGTMHDIGTLGGTESYGYGINDSGRVTGYSYVAGDTAYHAFMYDGTMHDLGLGYGRGINDSGQVTGVAVGDSGAHAFVWTPTTPGGASGAIHDLRAVDGGFSTGYGISSNGQVTGWYYNEAGAEHAFLYDGAMLDLGTLGGAVSHGNGVNSSRQVVGLSYLSTDISSRAFLYTITQGMVDLNKLIDPLSGWALVTATGINNAGQITGWGRIAGTGHAFLLTPVPEPATLALVALGAAAFAIRRNRRITNLLCLCCALSVAAAAHGAQYTVSDLGTFGGIESFGSGLNASGQVSGTYRTTEDAEFHAFLWTPTTPNGATGTMIDLGTLGGPYSWGHGINASGQVAGNSDTTGDVAQHAILYDGTLHDLGTLGGTSSYGYGINDSGQVSGGSDTTGDTSGHATLWIPTTPGGTSGTWHDLGTLGGTYSYGYGINDTGQVTGYSNSEGDEFDHAFLWTPSTPNGASGTIHDLGTLGGTYCEGVGINDSGQVTGDSFIEGDEYEHAFLWTPTTPGGASGTMQDLGTLGGLNSYAYHLGPGGQVVGYSEVEIEGFNYLHAFLYTSGDGMVDLNTLIDPLSGWELLDAIDINDAGQITGSGLINDEYHAYLLTPIPPISGDFNGDNVVDGDDLTNWKAGFGTTGNATRTQGDADRDLDVDGADFLAWQRQFGPNPPITVSSAAVPEPATLTLIVLAAVGGVTTRQRWCARRVSNTH